ncbi:TVP38/TMEM64 family protein [Evansella cellulosilytica]|uniref:SNARE associated Golgi protein-related protein n=1 Tax=Evansella cellulosilytica (strain ATCC 21833 / DSM 2522 / FERM P-1141 / JCM 9156 / N-4) TaxID=649639 RepID=E6U0J2_EVAC2|nr:VTT domain-containing protein [Evansella cellulosilytica]ADU31437.1 SNARE associated Golgi protein-related protein [Evansella cellulosilytica DSM 2522]
MDMFDGAIPHVMEEAGFLAPILFVLIHLIRPFLFIPVIVVCIAGGILFGFVHGTIYNIIGLSLMSLIFYKLVDIFPSFRRKITNLKKKLFKDRVITLGQVMILRMMPFMHFHLLSLYLMEMTKSFNEYMRYSIGGVILPSIIYTAFGQSVTEMPIYISAFFFLLLIGLYVYLGKYNTTTYKWNHFFHVKSSE